MKSILVFGWMSLALGLALPVAAHADPSLPATTPAPVKLEAMRGFDCPPVSGCSQTPRFVGSVRTLNVGTNRAVFIEWQDAVSSEWKRSPAAWQKPYADGTELWSFDIVGTALQFVVVYEVDGVTYRDDNGGGAYQGPRHGYSALLPDTRVFVGPELQWPSVNVGTSPLMKTGYDSWEARLVGSVWVRADGEPAEVEVVYTDDAWATTKTVAATPVKGHAYFTGVEMRTFSAPVVYGSLPQDLAFFVVLRSGGTEVRDDNGGENFGVDFDTFRFER